MSDKTSIGEFANLRERLPGVLKAFAAGIPAGWIFDRLGTPIPMIIATSPGGLAEMTITAQALQISVPLVVAFHLLRVVVVNMGTQYFYRWAAWLFDANPRV